MTSRPEDYVRQLEADNRRLRRLLEARDAPGELRHRLRSTIAAMRAIIRKSARTARDQDVYVAHVEDRLDALARAQAAADEHGVVDLHQLISDELFHYRLSEGDQIHLSGPAVQLQPKAGQVMALAIHELAVNAVEHGGSGVAEVSWTLEGGREAPVLVLRWKEPDTPPSEGRGPDGFGTEVLTRMLPYEIGAQAALTYEGGLQCVIRLPLTARNGAAVDR